MSAGLLPPPIHIILAGRSADHANRRWPQALAIFSAAMRSAGAELWTEQEPPLGLSKYPIRRIRPFRGEVPHTGTFVFIGSEQLPGNWYEHARPGRVMLECVESVSGALYAAMRRLSREGVVEVDVGFVSDTTRRLSGLPGRVHILCLLSQERLLEVEVERPARPFTIGKASCDTLPSHHFRDLALYEELARAGCKVRVAGGACLIPYRNEKVDGLSLLPELTMEELPEFFAGIDCFFHRTALQGQQGFAFSIIQAMASGLPIIVHCQAQEAEFVHHGENGFIFGSNGEAEAYIRTLADNARMRWGMGLRSRQIFHELQAHPWFPYE